MKKFNVFKSFKSNRFKHEVYSIAVTAIFMVILVAVNLLAVKLNIKKDLTEDKLYTLTQESANILKDLKNDIKIIMFFETGKTDPNISAVVEKYKAASKKVNIEERDPIKQPQLAQRYSKDDKRVGIGTIVVEHGNKFKAISYDDFFNYSIGVYGEENIDSFAAEQQITNAIIYVTSDKEQIVYTLTGHGEGSLNGDVSKQLEVENYTVKELNLLQGNAELSKDSILVISSPKRDISKEEAGKIKVFLTNGGRAAFFIDITMEPLPNLQVLLNSYGVKLQNAIVVEGDAGRVSQSQIELLPEIKSHDIVNAIKSNKMLLFTPISQGIEKLENKRDTVKIESLLTTSSNSWAKTNLNSTSLNKESEDLAGPFNIAVTITEETADNTTKLVVVGGSTIMNSNYIASTNGANLDFLMNSFNWLQGNTNGASIRPKSLSVENLAITNFQKLTAAAVVVILIPAVIMAAGIIVWLRRKHR